ncbi:MAG: hypothetical protein IID41_07930 [Planctomycetes bacterium]|nr:hypothetical protein [Planctomycetota bacterium]
MPTTIERIKGLRANREGRYHDLLREAGACDASGNGRELTHDDLKDLDETSLLLGRPVKTLADDLNAATRFHALTRQLADAEDQKPAADRNITKLDDQLKQAVANRNAANDARNTAKCRCDTEAGRVAEKAYNHAAGEISRLQNEAKAVRKPLAACEVLPKQISELVAQHPWVRGGANGR